MSEKTIVSLPFELKWNEEHVLRGTVKTLEHGLAKPVVVIAHGFKGFKDWGFWPEVTDCLAESGFYAVSFDFSRVAAKEAGLEERIVAEASTVTQELVDLDLIVQHVKQAALPLAEQVDVNRIAVIGHSRAGATSIIYAGEHPEHVSAVVVWNEPAAS